MNVGQQWKNELNKHFNSKQMRNFNVLIFNRFNKKMKAIKVSSRTFNLEIFPRKSSFKSQDGPHAVLSISLNKVKLKIESENRKIKPCETPCDETLQQQYFINTELWIYITLWTACRPFFSTQFSSNSRKKFHTSFCCHYNYSNFVFYFSLFDYLASIQ